MRHLTRTSISVETAGPVTGLDALAGVHDLVVDDHRATFDVDTARLDDAMRHLTSLGIRSLTSQPPTLEELFLRHYGDELRSSRGAGRRRGDGRPAPLRGGRMTTAVASWSAPPALRESPRAAAARAHSPGRGRWCASWCGSTACAYPCGSPASR